MRRVRLPLALSAALALLAAACAKNAPLDTLRPEGPYARQIYRLWDLVFYLAVAVFVVVEGAILVAIVRFRRRRDRQRSPKQTHGNTALEITWTIIPALLLAGLAVPTITTIFALARTPAGAVRVEVRAQQWFWRYYYSKQPGVPKAFQTANELHIPTGRPVYLTLHSNDVIHSYWIPELAGKQDVVPGRTNHLTIEAARPGTYLGTCVEYCGLSHANMRIKVVAQSFADFSAWAANQGRDYLPPMSALARKGMQVFMSKPCVGCHTIRGTQAAGTTGPDLTHFATRSVFAGSIFTRTPDNLRRWLTDAPGVKPGSKMPAGVAEMGLTQDDITALIAFLEGLK